MDFHEPEKHSTVQTLMMPAAKVVQKSVITNQKIAFQYCCQLNDQSTQSNVTPELKPVNLAGNTFLHSYLEPNMTKGQLVTYLYGGSYINLKKTNEYNNELT